MPYYPILKAPSSEGWTTLSNFPPNNWEIGGGQEKFVNVTWASDGFWHTKNLGLLGFGKFRMFSYIDIASIVPKDAFPFLSMSSFRLPELSEHLPDLSDHTTNLPIWRSTLGLSTSNASVSFQGEINPFHSPGSLLTFCPFIQSIETTENYLLFINLENSAVTKTSELKFFNSRTNKLKLTVKVENNNLTVVALNSLSFKSHDLPLIICPEMSGIPLFYSKTSDGRFLSLEHTHPPASFVVHGKRWEAQKVLKEKWLSRLI